jgi:hypothetical protein
MPRERRHYRQLSLHERTAYDSLFWRYADALYLTDGNETRTEHFARHAEGKLIAAAPVVNGSTSWGNDVAELTIRYGTPKARTREPVLGMGSSQLRISEHWDPEQLLYAPPALDSTLNLRARPAMGWPLDTVRSVSGHASPTIRRMLPLEHQASVFRNADGRYVLRVDGRVVADSAARVRSRTQRGLFVLDGKLLEVARMVDEDSIRRDTLLFAAEVALPTSASYYSAELIEPETRLAARSRFRFTRPQSDRGLELSDILIALPFSAGALPTHRSDPNLKPRSDLLIPAGHPFGVYSEITQGRESSDSVQVGLELIAIDGRPTLLRAARWVGTKLGLSKATSPYRLSWVADIDSARPAPIAITLDAGGLKPGRYFVELTVVDVLPGDRRATSRREIVIIEP